MNCGSESGMAEKYVRLMQDMYKSSMPVMRCAVGVMAGVKMKVGLH